MSFYLQLKKNINMPINWTPAGSRRSPSPYATTQIGEHVYAKPESRVSYYAASNLTHVSQVMAADIRCDTKIPQATQVIIVSLTEIISILLQNVLTDFI